ncbi:MAG TPA: TonB-dependent receptor, partial [Mucilaginibacter sp.]|nr:TonB-dependent receptor [Mucilaginibacter sp.]
DSYTELDEERKAVTSVGVPYYSRKNTSYTETNYDLLATVDKNLSKQFNLKALLGTNIRKQNTQSIYAITNGGLIVPGIYSLSNSANAPNAPYEYKGLREVDGVFAGATLTYNNLLTLDGTIRRDKSSTLPASNNTYYYPSVSGGFIFSELLKQLSWLSYGKLRANYAQVGGDAPIYSVLDTYTVPPPFNGNPQSAVNTTKNNPDLKPERTKSAEVGLEFDLFDNRLGFNGSYYTTETFDQILGVNVSTATGYSFKFLNAGTVKNKGIELSLNGTPIRTQDFNWKVTLNYTRNRNKVTELFKDGTGEEAKNLELNSFQGGVSINATLDQPYGTIRGTDYIYDKTTGQKVVGANGQYLQSGPTATIGNTNPDWIGGINNSFTYKGFNLSFLIDVRKGGSVFSTDMYYGLATGLYQETAYTNDLGNPVRNTLATGGGLIRPGVKEDGTPNTTRVAASYGAFGYVRLPNKAFVYDAGFVKLREAIVGYTLPQKTIAKLPIKEVTFQLIGRNLWIIHKNLPYADPEDGLSSGNLQGYQVGSYPTTRTISLNLKLRF